MKTTVHLLWFGRERQDGEDSELLIGVYGSEDEAHAAIARLKDKPGFAEFPEGFEICPYELGQDHWAEGFVRT